LGGEWGRVYGVREGGKKGKKRCGGEKFQKKKKTE